MSARKPPRLATWLLARSGFGHQNPPLTGDLLEEFRSGRSASWYWRQTLVVILRGLAWNVRLFRQFLIAYIIGWALQAGVAFGLWWFHLPAQLQGSAKAIAWPLTVVFAFLLVFLAAKLLQRRRRRSTAEVLETRSQLEDHTSELGRLFLLRLFAWIAFCACLTGYCVVGLLTPVPSLPVLVGIQAELLLVTAAGALAVVGSGPGPARMLTTRR